MDIRFRVNIKLIIFFVITLVSLLIFYYAEDKALFINFFFIPTLLAGYAYDARGGIITALVSITFVTLIYFMTFDNYAEIIIKKVILWGAFLIISGYIAGTLNERINAAHLGAIATLALAMESRDPYTYGHSSHVSEVAVRIAKKLRWPKSELKTIRIAGMLHDIGKFGVRENILRKSGPLTSDEFDHIRQHPFIGTSILSPVRLLKDIIPYIYYHHERTDGKGYLHKKGSEIPTGARILAVADAYDAMTTNRPYRKALIREKILKIFKEDCGKQFDKKIVDILLEITDDLRINIKSPKIKGIRDKAFKV